MKLNPQQVYVQFAVRISSGSHAARRRPLKAVLPAAADYALESRLMLSASSGDEIPDESGSDPSLLIWGCLEDSGTGGGGADTLAGGDTSTGGSDGDTGTGGGGADITMGNMPPILSVTLLPIPDTAVNGDVVGYATATDLDVGDTITLSFDGGSLNDPSGTFAIDANTGVITIANADNIGSQDESSDSPTGWSFAATVVASDGPRARQMPRHPLLSL